jgi:hypothetical protein
LPRGDQSDPRTPIGGGAAAAQHLGMRYHRLLLTLLTVAALSGGGAPSALADDPSATHKAVTTSTSASDTCTATNVGVSIPGSAMLFHDGCTTRPVTCQQAGGCHLYAYSTFTPSSSIALQTTQNMRVRVYNNGVYVSHSDDSCAKSSSCTTTAFIWSIPVGWSATAQCNGTNSPFMYAGWPINVSATNSCMAFLYW